MVAMSAKPVLFSLASVSAPRTSCETTEGSGHTKLLVTRHLHHGNSTCKCILEFSASAVQLESQAVKHRVESTS